MEIEIKHIKRKKEYIDELYGITSSYKKLMKNPHAKVTKMSRKIKYRLLFFILYNALVVLNMVFLFSPLDYFGLGIGILAIVIEIKRSLSFSRILRAVDSDDANSAVTFDNSGVKLSNHRLGRDAYAEWNTVIRILFTEHCIVFMPEYKKEHTGNVICVPREYENEVLAALKEYNKTELAVYNK